MAAGGAARFALLTLLQTCSDSAWALDTGLSGGLVNRQRSELFRLADRLSATKQAATTTPDQVLSAAEQAQFRATLAAAGYSDSDLSYHQGQWRLGSASASGDSAAGGSASRDTTEPVRKIEAELRTLWVSPYTLFTASERKEQATRSKTVVGSKRSRAYPEDEEIDCLDTTLNPFSEWPWEQGLRLSQDLPYKRAGRLLRNALRWSNKFTFCPVMKMTQSARTSAADKLFEMFSSAVSSGQHDLALLVASQAVAEATEQMQCIVVNALDRSTTYPGSAFMVHVAKRRQTQATELKVFLADIATRITDASKAQAASYGGATAAWVDFLSGWLSRSDSDLVEPDSMQKVAQASSSTTSPAPAGAFSTPPRATSSTAGSQRSPKASPSGTAGGGGSGGAKGSGNLGAGNSSSGGGGAGGAAASGFIPVWRICKFKVNIPCSADIVGDSLGVTGAGTCSQCNNGDHYHGECPLKWGNTGTALPGFTLDGQRIAADWKDNEPLKRVVKQWVTFLKDFSNFNHKQPSSAGAAGAPSLSDFEARVDVAPKKK